MPCSNFHKKCYMPFINSSANDLRRHTHLLKGSPLYIICVSKMFTSQFLPRGEREVCDHKKFEMLQSLDVNQLSEKLWKTLLDMMVWKCSISFLFASRHLSNSEYLRPTIQAQTKSIEPFMPLKTKSLVRTT